MVFFIVPIIGTMLACTQIRYRAARLFSYLAAAHAYAVPILGTMRYNRRLQSSAYLCRRQRSMECQQPVVNHRHRQTFEVSK
jgi:hypothetical protein